MSYADDIRTLLAADGTLMGFLTGGLYTFSQTGRMGINRDDTPDAFNDGVLKPCGVVKGRATVPFGDLADPANQFITVRQVVEVWIYDDGAAGYTAIRNALNRIYLLLHDKQMAGVYRMRFVNGIEDERASELNNACWERADYAVFGQKAAS